MRRVLVVKGLKMLCTFSISYTDVMLKWNGLLRNIFHKHFEEKYKHNKVALNFVLKQCFSQKTHFILILINLLYRDQIVSYSHFHNISTCPLKKI